LIIENGSSSLKTTNKQNIQTSVLNFVYLKMLQRIKR